jgi:hypothetical protein
MMNREGKDLRCMVEEAANIFTPLGLAEFAAVPDSIVGKEAGDGIRVVVLIARCRVASFKAA